MKAVDAMNAMKHYVVAGLVWGAVSACASGAGDLSSSDVDSAAQWSRATAALEAEECLVPEEVLEHTCQHAEFGPFASATAQAYPGFVFTDISPAHTAYNLTLPGTSTYQGAVLYSPVVSGEFAFFSTPEATVTIYDSANNPVTLEREGLTDPAICSSIEKASVFHLEVFETYTVVFGPQTGPSVATIVEYLGEGGCETCAHVHLDAYRSLNPNVNEPAEVVLDAPIAFEVPEVIAVEEGQARRGTVTFTFRNPGSLVKCLYKAHQPSNTFVFHHCTHGVSVGDDVTASEFQLVVSKKAAKRGPIAVELELEDEACHEHDHED